MKKYTPSVKNNNAVKEELCSEMKGLLYHPNASPSKIIAE